MDTIKTPANYRNYWNGRDLGPTMQAWRVQKTGYREDPSMLPGVVAGYWGYKDAPDSEVIAGGLNTKGPRYVALGRHGPFFQWGFSATPDQMTESGRRAFVNAICYIRQFDRKAPLTRKVPGSPARGFVLDSAMSVARLQREYDDYHERHLQSLRDWELAKEIQRTRSRPLTKREEMLAKFSRPKCMSFERYRSLVLRAFPAALVERLGVEPKDLVEYLPYFEKNLRWIHRGEKGFVVDEDAKALGIANNDPALLEKCVALLESGKDQQRAMRLLRRYTDRRFEKATDWRAWLVQEGDSLFFSDVGGYRFYSSRRQDAEQRSSQSRHTRAQSSDEKPVVFEVKLLRSALGKVGAGAKHAGKDRVTVEVRMRIAKGWHTYAQIPASSPYTLTEMELDLPKGASVVGPWRLPRPSAAIDDPETSYYTGEAVFRREVKLDSKFVTGSTFAVTASWQACNKQRCRPPARLRRTCKFDRIKTGAR